MAGHFLPEIDPNFEFLNHFVGANPSQQEPSAVNFHNLIGYQHENPFPPLPDCISKSESFPGLFIHDSCSSAAVPPGADHAAISNEHAPSVKKRKSATTSTPESGSANSSSRNGKVAKSSSGRGKKVKQNGKEEAVDEETVREVVHVRARRGQATDSHSIAERVRRGKINERFRCLQDIVPGCYKTMGMAVMLDEIINYVQSLQNQVEFLSMKLTAASTMYDFNSDMDIIETAQGLPLYILQKLKTHEQSSLKLQNAASQGLISSQFAPEELNSEFYPHFPPKNS